MGKYCGLLPHLLFIDTVRFLCSSPFANIPFPLEFRASCIDTHPHLSPVDHDHSDNLRLTLRIDNSVESTRESTEYHVSDGFESVQQRNEDWRSNDPKRQSKAARLDRPLPYLEVILTIVLSILLAVVIVVYDQKHAVSKVQKHVFETLTTGLLLISGT